MQCNMKGLDPSWRKWWLRLTLVNEWRSTIKLEKFDYHCFLVISPAHFNLFRQQVFDWSYHHYWWSGQWKTLISSLLINAHTEYITPSFSGLYLWGWGWGCKLAIKVTSSLLMRHVLNETPTTFPYWQRLFPWAMRLIDNTDLRLRPQLCSLLC